MIDMQKVCYVCHKEKEHYREQDGRKVCKECCDIIVACGGDTEKIIEELHLRSSIVRIPAGLPK